MENPAPNLAGDAMEGKYVSRMENVAAAVNEMMAISSIFKDLLGIANATIATIKPWTKYLIIRLTNSFTFTNPFIILNNKKKT